jgi:hypothetical protein
MAKWNVSKESRFGSFKMSLNWSSSGFDWRKIIVAISAFAFVIQTGHALLHGRTQPMAWVGSTLWLGAVLSGFRAIRASRKTRGSFWKLFRGAWTAINLSCAFAAFALRELMVHKPYLVSVLMCILLAAYGFTGAYRYRRSKQRLAELKDKHQQVSTALSELSAGANDSVTVSHRIAPVEPGVRAGLEEEEAQLQAEIEALEATQRTERNQGTIEGARTGKPRLTQRY